jgi:glutamate synthase (NADPH/NADH) small chain
MEHEKISLSKSQEVAQLLEERGIHDEEIKRVIHNAESTGDKLYQQDGDKFLARLRILEATFYVEYSVSGENYTVHSAYAHRAEMVEK